MIVCGAQRKEVLGFGREEGQRGKGNGVGKVRDRVKIMKSACAGGKVWGSVGFWFGLVSLKVKAKVTLRRELGVYRCGQRQVRCFYRWVDSRKGIPSKVTKLLHVQAQHSTVQLYLFRLSACRYSIPISIL